MATAANVDNPTSIIIDRTGNLFFTDNNGVAVRKISTSGIISHAAGRTIPYGTLGDGSNPYLAAFDAKGIAVDNHYNIYIASQSQNRIRKINHAGTLITTFAGNGIEGYSGDGGQATAAELGQPAGVAVDKIGNMYIADYNSRHIRKIDTTGIISTIAGGGTAGLGDGGSSTNAQISAYDIAVDTALNVYIVDYDSNRIRKVNGITGIITTIAGNGTSGTYSGEGGHATAAVIKPTSVAIDWKGNIYLSDNAYGIRKIDTSGIITTLAGVTGSRVNIDRAGNIYVSSHGPFYSSSSYNNGKILTHIAFFI